MYSWFLWRIKTEFILAKESEYVSAVVHILKESGGSGGYLFSPKSGMIFTTFQPPPLTLTCQLCYPSFCWNYYEKVCKCSPEYETCGNSFVLLEFSVTFDTILQIQILGIILDFSFPPVSFMLKMIMGFFFLAYLYGESYWLIFEY